MAIRKAGRREVVDPVCGMSIDANDALSSEHHGHTYYFCSETCRGRFQQDPVRFVDEEGRRRINRPGEDAARDEGKKIHRREPGRGTRGRDYLPLLIVIGSAIAAATARQAGAAGPWSGMAWMHDFMGLFLVIFAMFKFFDLPGFADGFQMYDLLARRARGYAWVYPFIELGLGLGYLTQARLPVLYGVTVAVMIFGAMGVIRALRKGLDLNCACMGTVLKVPLSTVALTEDLGMAAMAAVMWLRPG
ncbi:MAG: hypothetical protein K0R17_496 [Rariglobus sp.]|nr:hypothetical protein [Rariglobus sp.]